MYRRNGYESRREQRTPRLELAVWRDLMSERGPHMHLPGHDPNDPYSCICYPKPSSIKIPSMVYDEIRCPHPEKHHLQPAQDDVFAYPWTVQTYEPPLPAESFSPPPQHIPKPPLSAKTAPPFVEDKVESAPKVTPPYSAPAQTKVPKLNLRLLDNKPPQRSKVATTPTLTVIGEGEDEFEETRQHYPMITQYDSVSQVLQRKYSSYYRTPDPTPNHFREPNRHLMRRTPVRDPPFKGMPPRTREVMTRDLPTRQTYYSRFEYSPPAPARVTPGARSYTATMSPMDPHRKFQGHYVDPKTGDKIKYDVRYGRRDLEGNRRLITTQ